MFTPEAIASYLSAALLTIVNLLIAYFVLKRFLFKPILNVLRKRRESITSALQEAEEKLNQASEKVNEAERRLDVSTHEAAEILAEARGQAEEQKETILQDARRNAAGLLTRAEKDISRMRLSMLNDVRDEVADLSVTIASRVIGQAMDEHRQREWVNQFLDQETQSDGQPALSPDPHTNEVSGHA